MRTKPIRKEDVKHNKNKPQSDEVYLILENIRSIHNVGAILRTADAAGVNQIFLCGITGYPSKKDIKEFDKIYVESPLEITDDILKINYIPSDDCYKKSLTKRIKKTALLATHSNFQYKESALKAINELKKIQPDLTVYSIEQAQNSVDYSRTHYKKPFALIVGNEITGINNITLSHSDHIVEIKMNGECKSLNVSTALGIVLFKSIEENSLF